MKIDKVFILIIGILLGTLAALLGLSVKCVRELPKDNPVLIITPKPTVYHWYFDGKRTVIGFPNAPLGLIQDYCKKGDGITTVSYDGMMENKCQK